MSLRVSASNALIELGQSLLLHADRSLLDARLDALHGRVLEPEVGQLFASVYEAGEASSLRELLEPQRLAEWLEHTVTAREEAALRTQLERWLGMGHGGGDEPTRLVQVPNLPDEIEALLQWARPFDLLGELSRPAAEVLPKDAEVDVDLSMAECLLDPERTRARGRSLLDGQRARELVRSYLCHQAALFGATAARTKLWQKPLPSESLKLLRERLSAFIGQTDFAALHSLSFVPAQPVSVDVDTGVCRGFISGLERGVPVHVKLYLSGHEQRVLSAACDVCKRPGCLHTKLLAARMLDACHDEEDRLHSALRTVVGVPSWKRFLEALRVGHEAEERSDERLCFRVRIERDQVAVGTFLQQLGADGRFSAGKLVAPTKMLRSTRCREHDRAVLEALALSSRSSAAQFVHADLGVLRGLVEHPCVRLDGGDEPLRISEQTVEVKLMEQPEGLLPKVTLAGVPVPYGQRRREQTYLLELQRAEGLLVIAALTPTVRRLLAALDHFRGVLPPESYAALSPWLVSLRSVAQVSVPKALTGNERPTPRKLLLRITPFVNDALDVALTLRPLPLGALWPPGQGPELVHGLEDGVQVFTRRDLAWERATAEQVLEHLKLRELMRLEPFVYRVEEQQVALQLLSDAARFSDLIDIEWAERARKLSLSSNVCARDLKIDLFKRGQWLAIGGRAHNAQADIAVGRLLEAARRGERFVRVQGDTFAEIEQELFERLANAQLITNEGARELMMAASAVPYWFSQLGDHSTAADEITREWIARRATGAQKIQEIDGPAFAHLRDYQREGVAFLLERSAWADGVCLADEMGLGKTIQAVALLELRAAHGPQLVVAPTSVVMNWVDEISRFGPSLEAKAYQGSDRRAVLDNLSARHVVVTSYDVLLRDKAEFERFQFATQIIDEAQLVRNAHTSRARAVASIRADFRVALSGTPIENRLGDLWSLFHLISPGLLGGWPRFRARFAVPIERYEDEERAAALRSVVAPFLLRRAKRDVAKELPSRTEIVHRVELSQVERDLYDAAEKRAQRALGKRKRDDAARSMMILAELTRLRQLACHPRLVLEEEDVASSKLAVFIQLLEDVLPRGHRVLVFSQFTQHLGLVREALDKTPFAYLYLDGSTPAGQRSELVERFQLGEAPVFLISLKAGGTGLNLTAADYVIHLDPWWNPAAEDQASDRAHRIGQDKPVTIVKLVSEGTIEEKVLLLHEHKRRLAASVLSGAPARAMELTSEDLERLIFESRV